MERLVIIDHDDHVVYFVDVTDDMLEKYNGSEQAYLDENCDSQNYSWDYVTDLYYIRCDDPKPRRVDIEKSLC